VALPAFGRLRDPDRKAEGFAVAVAVTVAGATLAGVLLSALATSIIPLLYGEKWQPAAAALAGLAVFGAIRIVAELLANFLVAVGATRKQLVAQLMWVVALIPAMVLGIRWAGLAGAGWSNAAVAGLVIVPAYLWLSRRYRVVLGGVVRRISLSLVAAVPAAAAGMLAVRMVDNRFLACAFGATAATAIYAAVMFRPVRRWMAQLVALKEHASEAAPEPPTVPDSRQLTEQRA
jgi:lipopolysaccharide exporter